MLTSLLKMILCHLLGDFVLQPKFWVSKRETNIRYLLYHVAVHAGLLILFFITDLANNWLNILFLVTAHLAIDSLKIGLQQKWPNYRTRLFLGDQLLHFITIFAIYFFNNQQQFLDFLTSININKLFMYIIGACMVIFVSPIVIRIFFMRWHTDEEFLKKRKESLMHAGNIIGILERTLIVAFILMDFEAGIGFLLATKSVFRFGDLTRAKDTKFTEYVLIGTLLSFGFGMAIGYGLKFVLTLL